MSLKAKIHVERQKTIVESDLEKRLASLQERGKDEATCQNDAGVRQIRAKIRQAKFKLERIAAREKLNADLAQAKADRLAGRDKPREKPPAEAPREARGKKAKKEKPQEQAPVEQEPQE